MRAIIGGSSLFYSSLFNKWKSKKVKTPFGEVSIKTKGEHIFIQRHGSPPVAPHMINHRANIWALKDLETKMIVSINSVGSLKVKLKPGTFVVPHDFVSFWDIPTFYDYEMKNIVPEMDKGVRDLIINTCKKLNLTYVEEGIYIQTRGPRFETKAEINILKRFGDIVGMTLASEATLSMEYELPYGSLCSVDNYCNGIGKKTLSIEELKRNYEKNLKNIEKFITEILEQ